MNKINIIKIDHLKELPLPQHATIYSAGVDLIAAIDENLLIKSGNR